MESAGELRHNTVVKLNVGPALKATDDPRTRDAVGRSVLENGPSTAAALGERLGLTPAGIRRHLDLLVADGILEAREPRISSTRGRGRPSKVFVMTDSGREKFEHSYDDLAVAALKFMSAQSGEHLQQVLDPAVQALNSASTIARLRMSHQNSPSSVKLKLKPTLNCSAHMFNV